MNAKVLIATSWWPTKTASFPEYARSVSGLINDGGVETELFITTSFADSKFRSIIESMNKAQEWAQAHACTHVLNMEADRSIQKTEGFLKRLVDKDKPVLVLSRVMGGSGVRRMTLRELDAGQGWGLMLVQTSVLERVPFRAGFVGDFYTPDRSWLKRLFQLDVPVWLDHEEPFELLEPAEKGPRPAFAGSGM